MQNFTNLLLIISSSLLSSHLRILSIAPYGNLLPVVHVAPHAQLIPVQVLLVLMLRHFNYFFSAGVRAISVGLVLVFEIASRYRATEVNGHVI